MPLRVLLVEDDPVFTAFVHQLLAAVPAGRPFALSSAGSLNTALAAIAGERPNVILLDLGLPDSSGLDTFNCLASAQPGLPIVILTGIDDEALALATLRAGAQDYLVKGDITTELLTRTLRYAHERSEAERLARQRDEYLHLILQELPIVIWSVDAELRVTSAEGAGLRGFGPQPLWTIGSSLEAPDDGASELTTIVAYTRRALLGESVRYQLTTQDRVMEVLQEPVRDLSRRVTGVASLCIDITDQTASEAHLRHLVVQLRALSARLNSIREEERARIARDLHDHLGQALTALKMDLAQVRRDLENGHQGGDIDDRLKDITSLLDTCMKDTRRLATELRPSVLDDIGIVAAIEWQLAEFQRRYGISTKLAVAAGDVDVDTARGTALFRIVQEALTNVIRHANASRVDVVFRVADGAVHVSVRDDGRGIGDRSSNPLSLGLLGMRERAALFGGQVTVAGEPGEGTTVTASLPLETPTSR